MPGRELVSEIASDLLPGVTEAAEFIDGRAKGLSCRLSIRLPEPESFDWQPANVRPASIMLTEPKAFVIPMASSLPRKLIFPNGVTIKPRNPIPRR